MTSKIYIPKGIVKPRSWEDIKKYYTPCTCLENWKNCLLPGQWREGNSACKLARSWEDASPNLPPEIQTLFGGSAELLAAIPEHETSLPGGPMGSKSDVLAFIHTKCGVCVVAVEGKKKESFDRKVGKWLKDASNGKIERLQYVTEILGLPYPPPDEIRYQLLHRTVAALIEAECFDVDCAAMIVHSFSENHKNYDDFKKFLNLLGIDEIKPDVLYKSEKLNIPLYLGWATGEEK